MDEWQPKDTVLIVDDDADNLKVLSALLYQAGVNVILAQSGPEALTVIGRKRPDLILLDIMMPAMDGFAVCRHLKQQAATRPIPIIFLTAATDRKALLQGFEAGAADYLTKPFHPPELLARVQTHLDLQRARQLTDAQNRRLSEQNQQLERQMAEIRELSAVKERYLANALHERVKELQCLYAISRLIEQTPLALEALFQGAVERMPGAWQYPDIACARIVYAGREYVSPNFHVTAWGQHNPIVLHGSAVGSVEVYYAAERPQRDEGPFLKEERHLITAIAEQMNHAIERMQVEAALRQREQQYRLLAQNVADGIALIQQGRILFANAALCAMLGYPNNRVIGMDPGDLFPAEDRRRLKDVFARLEDGNFEPYAQARLLTGDGGDIWVEERQSLIEWEGQPAMLLAVRDISDHKRREVAVEAEQERLRSINLALRASLNERFRLGDIIGKSAAMQAVYEHILNAAASDASVVVAGESGTGKELVAWTIHRLSARAKQVFVPVNCGAIPETLFESAFFGHRKGAFTGAHQHQRGIFESAHGGTLFLDEVGELTPPMQVKLLRALAGGGYTPIGAHDVKMADVRIVAAANRNLAEFVRQGRLREDFYYRITVMTINLPPLRERKEDLPLLIDHFWQRLTDDAPRLPGSVLKELYDYDWPGNVRELQNALQRYLTTHRLDFIAPRARTPVPPKTPCPEFSETLSLPQAVAAFERQYILQALEQHHWQRGKTAEALRIDSKTLYRKLKQHQV